MLRARPGGKSPRVQLPELEVHGQCRGQNSRKHSNILILWYCFYTLSIVEPNLHGRTTLKTPGNFSKEQNYEILTVYSHEKERRIICVMRYKSNLHAFCLHVCLPLSLSLVLSRSLLTQEPTLANEMCEMCPSLTFQQRLIGFGVCLLCGYLLSFLSTVLVISGDLTGFSMLYCLGSLIAIGATGSVRIPSQ